MRRNPLFVFLAAVFAAKLIVVLQLRAHPLLQPGTGLDSSLYIQLATRIAAGDFWLGPGLYFVSPPYVYFLVPFAFVHAFAAARVVQIVLGTAAVGLVYLAARDWFGTRAAWLAAILAALTGLFTFHEVLLLPAALDPFLTAAALAALARALAESSLPAGRLPRDSRASVWFLASGVVFGVHALNRPDVLMPAVVIAGLLIGRALTSGGWRAAPRGLLMAAGLVLALVPVTIRNLAVAGVWSPTSSPRGLGFYIGNNAEADGTYHPVPGISASIQGRREDARGVAEAAAGRRLDEREVSTHFYSLGRSWIRLHPADALGLFVRKLRFVFNAGHVSLNYSYPFYAHDAGTLLAVLSAGPWLLLPLGLVGLASGLFPGARPGPSKPGDSGRTEYLIWLSFVPLYAVSVAVFFVTEQARLPLLVPLCVGAGAALDRVLRLPASLRAALDERAEGQRVTAPGLGLLTLGLSGPEEPAPRDSDPGESARMQFRAEGIGLGALLVLALFANQSMKADDGRSEERARMAEALVALKRYDEADAWLEKAEADTRRPAVLHARIGRLLLAHGKPIAALGHFERALRMEPNAADVEYAIGQSLANSKRFKEAVPHLEAALRGGVPLSLVGFDLAIAQDGAGDRAGALQTLQGIRPQNPVDPAGWIALGELAMQLQAPSLAVAFFNGAIQAAPRAPKPHLDMARALAMTGRRQEAIAQLQEGVALEPSDADAQLDLATALAQAGRKADARMHAQTVLRLRPDDARARRLLRGLR